MLNTITDTQALAAKKHAGAKLRKHGLANDIRDFAPNTLDWSDLQARKKDFTKLAKGIIDEMTDDKADDEVRRIECAYDGIMHLVDACENEMNQRSVIGNRGPRNHDGDHRRPNSEDRQAQPDDFDGDLMEVESRLLTPEQRFADVVRAAPNPGLSLGRYLRAMVVGGETELERRTLAEGTDSAGGYTVPDILSASLIDLMRARTVAIRAGAQTVPLSSDTNHIARLASDPVPAWRAENAAINESDPTFDRVTFAPKSLAVLVKVSRELLEDSLNLGTELPRVLAAALAGELDRVVFLGTGTGSEPSGLDSITNVQTLAHAATITDYAPLVTARKQLMGENVEQVSAYVMHPDTEAEFGGLTDTTGQPLRYPPILDRPNGFNPLTTTQLPTNLGAGTNETTIYAGDFRQLVIGIRSNIRIEILKERYADNHQYAFVAHLRADVAATHPEAFCRITGVQLS